MANSTLSGLQVRRGQPEDIEAVNTICADVWGGSDYVPSIWLEWIAQPNNQFYLFELEGQPAALYCLRLGLAEPGSSWIQAVRVATSFKGRGLAAAIIEHAITTSRELGFHVLRYTTAHTNTPMHRLADRYGFRHIGNFLSYHFKGLLPPKPSGLTSRLVTTAEFDGAYGLVTASAEYRATEGFYCDNWLWRPLDIENLRGHIERREVFTLNGALRALAILTKDEEGFFWLPFLAGEPQARTALLTAMLHKVSCLSPQEQVELAVLLPQTPVIESLLTKAGFAPDGHEPIMFLYELMLS